MLALPFPPYQKDHMCHLEICSDYGLVPGTWCALVRSGRCVMLISADGDGHCGGPYAFPPGGVVSFWDSRTTQSLF